MSGLTLVIMAAGMASRYGSLKQLDGFGPNGEAIIDYSLYDAIRAWFTRVVFVIRPELEEQFRERFDAKLAWKIEVRYAFQTVNRFVPEGTDIGNRIKPWGTGHAVLCARDEVDGPFAVINADDFYGRESFEVVSRFLRNQDYQHTCAIVAYQLWKTLSKNGAVSRGLCIVDTKWHLLSVTEHTNIICENGKILSLYADTSWELPADTLVSVNFWGFKPEVFDEFLRLFHGYIEKYSGAEKAEFYLPSVVSSLIARNQESCQVFNTQENWFGVTYHEDKENVCQSIRWLIEKWEYPNVLF